MGDVLRQLWDGTPERDVTRLGLPCGPANGMMLGRPSPANNGERRQHHSTCEGGECFTLRWRSPAADLAVEVGTQKGYHRERSNNNDRWPIWGDGPFCLLDPGKYLVACTPRARKVRASDLAAP